jgi:hypothetical protein
MRSSPFVFYIDGIIDEAPTQCEPRNGTRAFTPIDGYSRMPVGMIAIKGPPLIRDGNRLLQNHAEAKSQILI